MYQQFQKCERAFWCLAHVHVGTFDLMAPPVFWSACIELSSQASGVARAQRVDSILAPWLLASIFRFRVGPDGTTLIGPFLAVLTEPYRISDGVVHSSTRSICSKLPKTQFISFSCQYVCRQSKHLLFNKVMFCTARRDLTLRDLIDGVSDLCNPAVLATVVGAFLYCASPCFHVSLL